MRDPTLNKQVSACASGKAVQCISRLGGSHQKMLGNTPNALLRHNRRIHRSRCLPVAKKSEESRPDVPLPLSSKLPLPGLPFVLHPNPRVLQDAHKPLGLIATSAYVLAAAIQLSGVADGPNWLPLVVNGALGGMALGLTYVGLNNAGMRLVWRSPREPLNVVITGGTKGIGKALAREFLRAGDRVVIASRSQSDADRAALALSQESGAPESSIFGIACDVADPESVKRLAEEAVVCLGSVDAWLNNAGFSGSFKPFVDHEPNVLVQIARTNLVGSLLCTQSAMQLMARQPRGGHIFNAEGAGSDGLPTVNYAAYGATKAGIVQLCRTLQHEAAAMKGENLFGPIGVHNFQPGMVLTDLLLEGATVENKRAFNILCEHPETVAAFLVPRIRSVVARGQKATCIRYLTPARALARLALAPFRLNRFFDSNGNALYPGEAERLTVYAKRTERLAQRAARRSDGLGLTYAASVAIAYLIIAVDQVAKAHGS